MWIKFYRVALLVWLPGVLDAYIAERPCSAPSLNNGYFLPMENSYHHKTTISYACEKRYKPAAEGWWTTSTCQNGKWSPEPQCIEDTACIRPIIPNAKHSEISDGWYKDGRVIHVTCNPGYTHKDHDATAECLHGKWSSVPVCEKSADACPEPPRVTNAVVMHQYQEFFSSNSEVEYRCKHTTDRGVSIRCTRGNWEEAPTCGSSTSSRVNGEDTGPLFTNYRCGKFPEIEHGVAEEHSHRSLKYKCARFYKLQGPETVVCHSNGKWSDLPTCRENFCSINTNTQPDLKNTGVVYLENGETIELSCEDKWMFKNYAVFQCKNLQPILSRCCNRLQIDTGTC